MTSTPSAHRRAVSNPRLRTLLHTNRLEWWQRALLLSAGTLALSAEPVWCEPTPRPSSSTRAVAQVRGTEPSLPKRQTASERSRDRSRDSSRERQRDSARAAAPRHAYPTGGTSAAARALAGRPVPTWPVVGPKPLPGSILPAQRIVAYYGNPLSKRMGALGEFPKDDMLGRLQREVVAWRTADPATPVKPALHLIAVVAQGDSGKDGRYRLRHSAALVEKVYGWARERDALLFLDVQVGHSSIQEELPRLEPFLSRPDVHFGMDPEFAMPKGVKPGKKIGSYDAADVNWVIDWLAALVTAKGLPPKILVVHRFTRPMLTNASRIKRDPRVQVVIDMDGWGPPSLKRDSYAAYVYAEPVQFAGFKLFYKNDVRNGSPIMTIADVLRLTPRPLYIQYQ